MAYFRCGGGASKLTTTVETYKSIANQETYTINEDVDLLIVAPKSGNTLFVGYVESNLYDSVVYGKEYAWGTWDGLLIVKGVKAGFQFRFGYADENVYIIKSKIE